MARIIKTRIDAKGNVSFDLSGFKGKDCEYEVDGLRRDLVELGLQLQSTSTHRKPEAVTDGISGASSSRVR